MSPSESLAESRQQDDGVFIESRRPQSRALSIIAGYFNVMAALNGLSWIAVIAILYTAPKQYAPSVALMSWRTLGMVATVAMQFRVGQLLHRRSREGGIWAIGALAPGVISRVIQHTASLSSFGLVASLVGIGLVALVWKELE